jgi:uncharacterized protein (TIGR02996 family)
VDLEDVFLRDALTHPTDPVPLCVYADWLEDQGDERAPRVRALAASRARHGEPTAWSALSQSEGPHFPMGRFVLPTTLIVRAALDEAVRLHHEHLGTHHLLLSLLRPEHLSGATSLQGVCRAVVEEAILRAVPSGSELVPLSRPPRTVRYAAAAGFTVEEADALGHETIAPAHLMLGLCRAGPCLATYVLRTLGVSPGRVCERVLTGLGQDPGPWLRAHPEVW